MEEVEEVLGTGKFVKFKISGQIELNDKVSLLTVVQHLEAVKRKAAELGEANMELSTPRIVRQKV